MICTVCGSHLTPPGEHESVVCEACGTIYRPAAETPSLLTRVFSTNMVIFATSWEDEFPLGLDWSKWQGATYVEKAISEGAEFIILRAFYATTLDSRVLENIAKCEAAGVRWGLYLYFVPTVSAVNQARTFADFIKEHQIGSRWGVIYPTLDFEQSSGLGKNDLANRYLLAAETLRDELNIPFEQIMFYTRASYWDYYVASRTYWKRFKLWVAHWNIYIKQPTIPADWLEWLFWQRSGDGNNQGPRFGVESDDVDMDQLNDEEMSLEERFPVEEDPPDPPPSECPNEARVTQNQEDIERIDALLGTMRQELNDHTQTLANHEQRITALEDEPTDPPPSEGFIVVEAKELSHFWGIAGEDQACGSGEKGKPILEINMGRIEVGEQVQVKAKAAYSCKDNPNDPFVLASGAVQHFESYARPRQYIRVSEVEPI